MSGKSKFKLLLHFILLISFVIIASYFSSKLWGGKTETIAPNKDLLIQDDMTVAEFGQKNSLPNPVMKKIFDLKTKQDLQKKIGELQLTKEDILSRVAKELALSDEYESKNWIKIPIKFMLWFAFLGIAFILMRKKKIRPKTRKLLYFLAAIIFGIILGSDPSPMGTVKDAIVLFGAKKVIFVPRMIALTIFLLMVVIANKFICSWGCQFGVLQDLIFRLNRNAKDTDGIMRQFKPPFWFTNSVRIAFFMVFTAVAFLWATDIVEVIDPFKIYNPTKVAILGGIFILVILIASVFIYRPWCHLFCPFGLVGWFFEKISFFRINVNYDTCIACEKCAKACPSTVMSAILKRDHIIPDCFACANCIEVCPTESIRFLAQKRLKPPEGKF